MTNPTEMLINIVSIAVQANVPIMLIGEPGVAKTAIVNGIGRSLGWPCVTKIGAHHDPTDFSGLPYAGPDGIELTAFKWARDISQQTIGDKRALLILDEFNLAQKSTLDSMLCLIHEGMVGDTKLGSGVARIAMSNPPEIANVPQLMPAMANRFFWLQWEMSIDYWVTATLQGYPDPQVTVLPANWRDYIIQARGMTTAFVMNSGKGHDRPKDESKWGGAWPSFRTWDLAGTLLAAAQSIQAGDGVESAIVEGCVGPGAAIEFMEYRRQLNLPHPKDVLDNPRGTKYPVKGDQLHALLNSVVAYTLTTDPEKYWVPAWEVLAKAADIKMDVAAASAKALAHGARTGNTFKWAAPRCIQVFHEVLTLAGMAQSKEPPGMAKRKSA